MLLKLTTAIAAFLVWAPVAQAWSWPVQGPVLQPFVYDEAHPYAAGQHRGIDIGADSAGEDVLAPAAGTVSFAGSVPKSGMSVTIQTADGYSVTLTHLGSILVAKGATVAERATVGTIGPSGTPEFAQPYLHLGIRTTADPNGYLDPLSFLPPVSGASSPGSDSTASQQAGSQATGSDAGAPAEPAPQVPVSTSRRANVEKSRSRGSGHGHETAQSPSTGRVGVQRPLQRPASHPASGGQHGQRPARTPARTPHDGLRSETMSSERPLVAATSAAAANRVDAGHELRSIARPAPRRPQQTAPAPLLPVVLNGLAALVAVAAACAAGRRRRGGPAGAEVLHFHRRAYARRAA